ncbi:MAG: hypothetical protein ACKOCN_02800, partial [Planctomycetaceae bacterium]
LMIRSATLREETRGVHVRSDYPKTSDAWRGHLLWSRSAEGGRFEPVEASPAGPRPTESNGNKAFS